MFCISDSCESWMPASIASTWLLGTVPDAVHTFLGMLCLEMQPKSHAFYALGVKAKFHDALEGWKYWLTGGLH